MHAKEVHVVHPQGQKPYGGRRQTDEGGEELDTWMTKVDGWI
jgi:hypothetical protein